MQPAQLARVCVLVLLALALTACRPVSATPTNLAVPGREPASAGSAAGWPTFTYPNWGITFRYPPDWQVEAGSWGVALIPPRADSAPTGGGVIAMEPYTISPGYDLRDWVQWISRDTEFPAMDETIITFAPVAQMPFAAVGDQVVYAILDNPIVNREIVWIAEDGLVFRIDDFAAPEVRYTLAEVAASLTFDRAVLRAIRDGGKLAGDETDVQARMKDHAAPYAAVAEAAVRNRQMTPPPVQPESPLQRYTGHSPYGPNFPDFTLDYDPTVWTLRADDDGSGEGDRLQNQAIEGCTFDLKSGSTETLDSRWRWIGDRWWIEAKLSDAFLAYSLRDENAGYYIFGLAVPELDPTDARQPCRRMTEQVLSTFAIVEQ